MREGEHKTSLNCSEPTCGRRTILVVMVMNVCMSKPERDMTKIYANVSFSKRLPKDYIY
jgi:hypothetical protein